MGRGIRAVGRSLRRLAGGVWWAAWRLAVLLAVLGLLGDGRTSDRTLNGRAVALARPYLFDFAAWEFDALALKTRQELLGVHPYLDERVREQQVIDYLTTLNQEYAIEGQIERVYADPDTADPAAATADLRAQRDALRRALAGDQPLVESIIEEQVSAVLVEEGFGTLGQVLPPVSMHFSALPMVLVISPRERIEFAVALELNALTVEQRAALETRVDRTLHVASLVAPLGGLSLYPSMIEETPDLARAFEVTAHEWAHHYLMFFPLGLEYGGAPETRILNETVATFFGRAVALKVLARYYPQVTPPVYDSFLHPIPLPPAQPAPAFDFGLELHRTRLMVDLLLKLGRVRAAEAYMEFRREQFVRSGYPIRKLNQAYFAFYGGYQGEPGAGGTDPIGPAVEELLALSPDLQHFLGSLRGMTTRGELLASLDRAHR